MLMITLRAWKMTEKEAPIKRDIVDNRTDDITMAKILNSRIPSSKRLDISTGYFRTDGYGMLRDTLEKCAKDPSFKLRLLLGSEAVAPTEDSFERYADKHQQTKNYTPEDASLKASLDVEDLTPESRDDAASLIKLLELANIQARRNTGKFNHSKCYILGDDVAFIGSSNLTKYGMAEHYELNAAIYPGTLIDIARKWFETMWEEGKDAKNEIITVLKQSKFGVPADPFSVYMKMAFEYFAPYIPEDDPTTTGIVPLERHQADAVHTAMSIIAQYGGAVIADPTGLGKTHIGMEILKRKMIDEGKKAVVIAPAQVINSMWKDKMRDARLQAHHMITMESLGRDGVLEGMKKYKNIEFVLVDESQNFRSSSAKRRKNLMGLIGTGKRKQVLLMSATPINNSLMDLYYQLSIITRGDNAYFYRRIGIPDLYRHMADATRDGTAVGLEKIEQLLDQIMVRRTRTYITEVYGTDLEKSGKKFPENEYSPIRYDLSGMFSGVFESVVRGIESLTMAPYGIEQYNTSLPEEERKKRRILAELQATLILKMFESSVTAAKTSLKKRISMYEHVRNAADRGEMLRAKEFNAVMAKWMMEERPNHTADDMDGDREKFLSSELGKIPKRKLGPEYDVSRLLRDIESDLGILHMLYEKVSEITVDTKIQEVERRIHADGALKKGGKKVLIFTEYTVTARYVTEYFRKNLPKHSVECITGRTGRDRRGEIIRRFSPLANTPDGEDPPGDQIDVLVSTEVLSEGQNLQDCNYVLNYDLPWNPMRIVQRIGRVDRMNTRHQTIRSRACYPDRELDDLLRLFGRLMDKISTVQDVIGLDMPLLDAVPSPKEFNTTTLGRIKKLAGGGGADSVIGDLEREVDLMPSDTPFNELRRYIRDMGIDTMRGFPMGRRSGKRGTGPRAILAYLHAGPPRRVYFVECGPDPGKARVKNELKAMEDIRCGKGEGLYLPMDGPDGQRSFEALLEMDGPARLAVMRYNEDSLAGEAEIRSSAGGQGAKRRREIKGIITEGVSKGELEMDDAERAISLLNVGHIGSWDHAIGSLLSEYRATERMDDLVGGLLDIEKLAGTAEEYADTEKADMVESDLKLVGAMFIS